MIPEIRTRAGFENVEQFVEPYAVGVQSGQSSRAAKVILRRLGMVIGFSPSLPDADTSSPGLSYSAFEEALDPDSGLSFSVRVFLASLMHLQCGEKDDLLQHRSLKFLNTFCNIGEMRTVVMLLLGTFLKG